jgi:hypothetical protein
MGSNRSLFQRDTLKIDRKLNSSKSLAKGGNEKEAKGNEDDAVS